MSLAKKPENVVRQSIRHGKTHGNLSKAIKMSRRRQENPTVKAKQSRLYRRNQREQKRFEAPLREFIEVKYRSIFQEYVVLFNQMNAQNPNKIDLKKTQTFKQWKRANEQLDSDILSIAIRDTIEQDHGEVNESGANNSDNESEAKNSDNESEANNSDNESEANNSDNESEANNSDNESEANNNKYESEANNSDNESEANNNEYEAAAIENLWGQDEGMLAAQQVDEIVNQMILDDELRALLNTQPEDDEGIELNIEDEIDYEDFDYRLEVEAANW